MTSDNINPPLDNQTVERERLKLTRRGRLNVVHYFILALSLVVTLAAWQYSKSLIALRTQARFEFAANQIPALVRERLQKYELALLAGVSALKSNGGNFDLAGWNTFASNLGIKDRYPGINGIGLIHQVRPDDLDDYLARERIARPDYTIFPPHDENIYQPITYIYPVETNAEAVGLDMVHEANRHSSLDQARDTDTPQITGPIILVQDQDQTPGFLFFSPFYNNDDHFSLEDRRASFGGAVYAPFIVRYLIGGTLDQDRRSTVIRISDGDQIIYDEFNAATTDYDDDALAKQQISMDLYGREWVIDIRAGLNFRAENSSLQSTVILLTGIGIDLALLLLFASLTRANRRGLEFADLATDALHVETAALTQANKDLKIAHKKAESVGAMKSSFLSTMSHEVRTPLTAISGILELLERAKLPKQQDGLVQAGKMASEKLLKLLTDVLDVSRLEANAVQLWERDVPLRPFVDEWNALASGMIEKHGKDITVAVQVSDGLPDMIRVDDIRLAQVMNNLMDNAIRFTERGSITISVAPKEGSADNLVLSMTDTGMGIAQDELSIVFERFRQVDGSITRTQGGSGLGLAICHDLVKLLGGEIGVSSEIGMGTTFNVTLPIHGATSVITDV